MSPALQGHLAMALFAALVSGSFSLGDRAAPFIAPEALSAARFLFAALLMGAIALAGTGFRRADLRAPWRYAVIGGCMACYFITMFAGLRIGDPLALAAVFTLVPLMSAGAQYLISGRGADRAMLAALALGAAGALWVIFRGDPARLLALEIGAGEAIFFIGCVGHAFYPPLVPKLNRGQPTIVFTSLTLVAGAVLAALWGWRDLAATDWAALPGVVWLALGYLAVFTTAITFFLVQFASMRLPAGKVMAWSYPVPAIVAIYEAAAGAGWPAPRLWIGVILIIGALVALMRREDD